MNVFFNILGSPGLHAWEKIFGEDEMEPGLYRKFTDEAGNIGIVALRDNSWNIIGFQEKR